MCKAYLTKAEKNLASGVMTFPSVSRALSIFNVAEILEMARKRVVSANRRPGHNLK